MKASNLTHLKIMYIMRFGKIFKTSLSFVRPPKKNFLMPDNTDLPRLGTHGAADEGIALVKLLVSRSRGEGGLGCLFRELPTADVGIDGHIELVTEEFGKSPVVTGRLVSVQIKSGTSYFENEDTEAWNVYIP